MSLVSYANREIDPFNLPPSWWGRVYASGDDKDRVRILAENGDAEDMIRYAAIDTEDATVKWLRIALKYEKVEAKRLLDYWMCALGLSEIKSDDAMRTYLTEWAERESANETEPLYLLRSLQVSAQELYQTRMKAAAHRAFEKYRALVGEDSMGRTLVCRLLGLALSGDQESQYYFIESLERISSSGFRLYKSAASKKLDGLRRAGDWKDWPVLTDITLARRHGFHPSKSAVNEKKELDRKKREADDAKAKLERDEFIVECRDLESEVRRLEAENDSRCCVCKDCRVDPYVSEKKNFTYAKRLVNGEESPYTITVSIPRCEKCKESAEARQREYDEDQEKRRNGKPMEDSIRLRERRNFKIVATILLLSPIAVWIGAGVGWFVASEIFAIFVAFRAKDSFEEGITKKIKSLYKDIKPPNRYYYHEYPPVNMLLKKGYQEGDRYVRPTIRF